MKKLFSVFAILAVFSCSAFANFFTNRFFEVRTNVPFDISNNSISLSDVLVPDLVIDLNEFYNNMPKSGFNTSFDFDPSVDLSLRILGVKVGFSTGTDMYGMVGLTKDIFKFIGEGNPIDENGMAEIKAGLNINADAFAYFSANASFSLFKKKFQISVTPTVFVPILHVYSDNSYASLQNTSDGNFKLNVNANGKIYSVVDPLAVLIDPFSASADFASTAGFDVSGAVTVKLFKHLFVGGSARIPVVPGHLNYLTEASYEINDYSVSMENFIEGNFAAPEGVMNLSEPTTTKYYINRPMKLNALATYKPLGNFVTLDAGLGMGIKNPFAKDFAEVVWYPEYLLSAKLSLFDVITTAVSTEYTNEVFKHTGAFSLNLRVFELDLAVSAQSTSLPKSLSGAGFGVYVGVVTGF